MEPSWIILIVTGIIVLLMMIYIFRINSRDKKAYEEDLNRPSNFYEDQPEANDTD